ncbi:MAG: RCC1 domain-containing protein [Deltaproteobacteria bacterium]|nr:RCC1 domain-containing protein [Deltaproteobacteria bacterium]
MNLRYSLMKSSLRLLPLVIALTSARCQRPLALTPLALTGPVPTADAATDVQPDAAAAADTATLRAAPLAQVVTMYLERGGTLAEFVAIDSRGLAWRWEDFEPKDRVLVPLQTPWPEGQRFIDGHPIAITAGRVSFFRWHHSVEDPDDDREPVPWGAGMGPAVGAFEHDATVATWDAEGRWQVVNLGAQYASVMMSGRGRAARSVMRFAPAIASQRVSELVMSDHDFCARVDARVMCWPRVDPIETRQAGRPGRRVLRWRLNEVTVPGTVAQLVAGERAFCALNAQGEVYCWGDGEGNVLATPRCQSSLGARRVESLPAMRSLTARGEMVCGIDTEARVWCWGELGKVGASMWPARTCEIAYGVPRHDVRLGLARQVLIGHLVVCALQVDGSVRCAEDAMSIEREESEGRAPPMHLRGLE